jgi:hypothetical protein
LLAIPRRSATSHASRTAERARLLPDRRDRPAPYCCVSAATFWQGLYFRDGFSAGATTTPAAAWIEATPCKFAGFSRGRFSMKIIFSIGILLVLLGIASLVVPISHTHREGISAGGMTVGVQTQRSERVSPIVSCALLLAGGALAIAGRSAVRR